MDLVAGEEPGSARVPMHFLSHAVANDPQAAIALALVAAFVPAIVEQPVLAGLLLVQNVGVLARYGAVDGIVFSERQIVASR